VWLIAHHQLLADQDANQLEDSRGRLLSVLRWADEQN
jgi:hypothetical protein